MSDQTVVRADWPKCSEHQVRCSVSHYDSWVYGEPRDSKTQSESFQHMVNLVLTTAHAKWSQDKFDGRITALHSLGPLNTVKYRADRQLAALAKSRVSCFWFYT